MADEMKSSFENTISQLLAASPKNSSKAEPVKAWIHANFKTRASVSRITEDKQLGNRIVEQFAHEDPIVVFVLEPGVNRKSLSQKIEQRRYAALNVVVIIGNNGVTGLSYEKLMIKTPTTFSSWCERDLGIKAEVFPDSEAPESTSRGAFQLITYGAPGTGKSFNIDKIVNDNRYVHFRTTFHPDSDYASFVGCYKPVVKEYDRIVAVGKKIEKAELDAAVPDELRKERKIEYTFVEQAFTKAYVAAWKNKAAAIVNGGQAAESVYLIIEEINRGNCAQVFGDIFQLLDREGGFSKYPICADDDLHRHLEVVFKGLDFGSQYAKVQTGEELVLPDNLYIWATMNTSDQSLFPMDSAFKRRWDWEYVPISEGVDENTKQKLDWNIVVKDVEKQPDGTEKEVTVLYSWWQFLQIINTKIYHLTDSEDKELGYFFAKPDSAEGISAKLFVNKVVFYLWTDVYKNYGVDNIFKGSDNGATTEEEKAKGVPFRQFFDETGKNANAGTLKSFFKTIGLKASIPTA